MTDETDFDLLATVSTLAGRGESTDTDALAAALEEHPASNGTGVGDVADGLGRLVDEGLIDVDGDLPAGVAEGDDPPPPTGEGAATITITPAGWTAIQPE
ncbi:hypothetical protein BH23ACT2_BH23ACT2_16200 [soil metagenome]